MEILKVSSRSVPNSVAGAVSGVIRDSGAVEVQAVGAGAANQAIKATGEEYDRFVCRISDHSTVACRCDYELCTYQQRQPGKYGSEER